MKQRLIFASILIIGTVLSIAVWGGLIFGISKITGLSIDLITGFIIFGVGGFLLVRYIITGK